MDFVKVVMNCDEEKKGQMMEETQAILEDERIQEYIRTINEVILILTRMLGVDMISVEEFSGKLVFLLCLVYVTGLNDAKEEM